MCQCPLICFQIKLHYSTSQKFFENRLNICKLYTFIEVTSFSLSILLNLLLAIDRLVNCLIFIIIRRNITRYYRRHERDICKTAIRIWPHTHRHTHTPHPRLLSVFRQKNCVLWRDCELKRQKSLAIRLLVQQLDDAHNEQDIKCSNRWSFVTTKGQWWGEHFPVSTSSCNDTALFNDLLRLTANKTRRTRMPAIWGYPPPPPDYPYYCLHL